MQRTDPTSNRYRVGGLLFAFCLHVAIGFVLLRTFNLSLGSLPERETSPSSPMLEIEVERPRLRTLPRHPVHGGAAAPRPSHPRDITFLAPTPPPLIPPVTEQNPVLAASRTDPSGNGEEHGSAGSGLGIGTRTGGDGGGGSGETPPRRLRGRISDRDYPQELSRAGVAGTVGVRYRVNVDGSVSDCRVAQSSTYDALDVLTCRLIEKRFRFSPARDEQGRPVTSLIVEQHSWIIPAAVPPPRE